MKIRNKYDNSIRTVHSGCITLFLEDEDAPHDPDFIRYDSLRSLVADWEDVDET